MNYVIIGAGAAGLSAAEELRKLDPAARITILSAEPEIYSRCMLHQYLGGERSLSSMRFVPEDFFERLNRGISEEERQMFSDLLKRMMDNLKQT